MGKWQSGTYADELLNGVLNRHSLSLLLNGAMLRSGLGMPEQLVRRSRRPWLAPSAGLTLVCPTPARPLASVRRHPVLRRVVEQCRDGILESLHPQRRPGRLEHERLPEVVLEQVHVGVQGEARGMMAKPALHLYHVASFGEQTRGDRVAEGMEPGPARAGLLACWLEDAVVVSGSRIVPSMLWKTSPSGGVP